jgi:hypothetical protein
MLGILMGTAAVILLVAVGGGISNQVQGQIGKLGTNAIYVLNERTTGGQDRGGTNARQIQLTPGDVQALEDKTRAPSVARVTPGCQRHRHTDLERHHLSVGNLPRCGARFRGDPEPGGEAGPFAERR